ncbi:MAG TPA: ribosome recycling factor [Dehalococcoidia bacterium]|jgi:ribosome recycling factor|nr:ribosome recycling factor [Chloroflexota bacterium]MDP6055807.1 ribosome recycling factor [Dehalococcoidia bacterium]MDP7261883.1 ribosome recycling factor [Dehalococcoidia bacterium]MDP7485462.1 ribosome recycling factor [Dehalococcoidia bacterium]HJP27363.1 ribosome recycling factor [Dehalococcoidia bacterium]|tara:strand:+ start:1609 stop:2166 length:558 start_codon:yes stop_codon:yes gene_type:complete
MLDETLADARKRMSDTVEALKREMGSVRTGRAATGLVENLKIDYFGSEMPLNQLAQINVGDARLLVIQPWDKNAIDPIAKAIQNSDLSISPNIDGAIIRLNLPSLTEERRRDLVRSLKARSEESKISIRNTRRDAQDTIRMIEKEGEASQDDCQRAQKDLQKLTDDAVEKIEVEAAAKEEQVMQV